MVIGALLAVADGQSLVVGGLRLDLGVQSPDLAGSVAQPPFGALGAAKDPDQRERTLRRALRLSVCEPLTV
jgi:hypothetical protein